MMREISDVASEGELPRCMEPEGRAAAPLPLLSHSQLSSLGFPRPPGKEGSEQWDLAPDREGKDVHGTVSRGSRERQPYHFSVTLAQSYGANSVHRITVSGSKSLLLR